MGGWGLTGRECDCEVEQEGAEDVIFLESEAIERVDEDQLEVQRNAQNEPVGDTCRAVGKLSRRHPLGGRREGGGEGGGKNEILLLLLPSQNWINQTPATNRLSILSKAVRVAK